MRTEPPDHKNAQLPHWLRDPTVDNGLASFTDMVNALKERAHTARTFVAPRFGPNKSRGATSTATPVGALEQRLYNELDHLAHQLDLRKRHKQVRNRHASADLKAMVKVADHAAKAALDAAFSAAQAIAKLVGHPFFWTAYVDVDGAPGKVKPIRQYVKAAVVQRGWTASPVYLHWALSLWDQRYHKSEYATRLRNLLHREAELAWRDRHLRSELFRGALGMMFKTRLAPPDSERLATT